MVPKFNLSKDKPLWALEKGNDLIPVIVVMGLGFGKRKEAGGGASSEAAVRVLGGSWYYKGKEKFVGWKMW